MLWRGNLAMLTGDIDYAISVNQQAISATAGTAGSPFSFQNVAIVTAIAAGLGAPIVLLVTDRILGGALGMEAIGAYVVSAQGLDLQPFGWDERGDFGMAYALPITLLGALFGWLFAWRGSLLAPIAAHALHNGLTILVAVLWPESLDYLYRR